MRSFTKDSYIFSDDLNIVGDGSGHFVFARGWLLEIIDLSKGEYSFVIDEQVCKPPGPRFGVYYPPFSIVKTSVSNAAGRVMGVGSLDPLPELPTFPVIFATSYSMDLSDIHQAVDVIGATNEIRRIDVNSSPSLVSLRGKRLIDENYLESPVISRIAATINVSAPHFSREFKRDFGLSPSGYLHLLRVADATLRLAFGEQILDISHEVGYNDLSRFYKHFKRSTKTSPGLCRETLSR